MLYKSNVSMRESLHAWKRKLSVYGNCKGQHIYALCASMTVQRKDTARSQKVLGIGGISK